MKPLVLAHRGDTQTAPENTLAAIEAALKLGADGVEVDLRLTSDGRIVLFHDQTLERLTGVPGNVEKTGYDRIKSLKVRGKPIPLLEELLSLVGDRGLLNLEVKTVGFTPVLEKKLIDLLQKFSLSDSVLISCFNPLVLYRLRCLAPQLRLGLLSEQAGRTSRILLRLLQPCAFHPHYQRLTKRLAHGLQARRIPFFVWTVNEENDMKAMAALGAAGIITDHPRRLLALYGPKPTTNGR